MIVAHQPVPLAVPGPLASQLRSDSRPSGRINSQLPCSQTIPVYPPRRGSCLSRAHFAKGCKDTETATLTTSRINTCKSVSKQRTLTPFRINTYKKTGEGGTPANRRPHNQQLPCSQLKQRPSHAPRGASILCALIRLRILPVTPRGVHLWPLARHSISIDYAGRSEER